MDKLKVSFTVRVNSEFEVSKEEVEKFKQYRNEGKEILKIDALKQEIANTLGVSKLGVEVLDHSETLIEGIGE